MQSTGVNISLTYNNNTLYYNIESLSCFSFVYLSVQLTKGSRTTCSSDTNILQNAQMQQKHYIV